MNLAIAAPFIENRGGTERIILKIAQEMDAKIYTLSFAPEKTYEGFAELDVEVLPAKYGLLPKNKILSAVEAGMTFYNLKLKDFDVVNPYGTPSEWVRNKNWPAIWYCNTPSRDAFDLYEWRMKRRNAIQKAMFWGATSAFKFFEFRTVPKIEHVFANSRNVQERLKKYLHKDSEVLYLGVEYKEFRQGDYKKYFFYPSRIVQEKDFEFAIEAFDIFSREHKGYEFVIAGSSPPDSEYLRSLKDLCAQKNVTLLTNLEDKTLKDLYSDCLAVLYSPVNEDFGLVPLEGMASGKPCISKNEGGPKETIDDGKDGFLVNSPQEMAQRMARLADVHELAEEMGKKGREKVIAKFNWGLFLKRFRQKAEELASKPR